MEILSDCPGRTAKVRVRGALIRVPLMLLPEAKVGDRVLVERGIAIGVEKTQ